jgi:hypothetical protein
MASGDDRAARRAGSPSVWSRRGALGIFAVAYGCTGSAPSFAPTRPVTSDAGIVGPDLKFDVNPGLACADGEGICVGPSQVVTFGIEATPGTAVSLSLQGDYADAALTAQEVTVTGSSAGVSLESASTTAAFSIVATAARGGNGQSLALNVTVSQSGNATIEATPTYTGHRPDVEQYASEFVLSTCAEVTAAPDASAGGTWVERATGVAIPLGVPAGERVAVDVRIGHYAFGCTDVDPLVPNAITTVPVQVFDIPLALSLTNLTAVLSFTPDATAQSNWLAVAQAAVARVESSFFFSATPDAGDGSALLDAMRAAIVAPADQAQFDLLRQSGGWDATTASWLSSHTPSIASRAATWLAAAESALGPLTLHIGGEPSGEMTAPVTVVSFGSLTWVAAGITQPAPFQWTADANDTVHLSGTIALRSTPLFAHQADALATAGVTGATGVASGIAIGIDCIGLASSLVGTGVSYGSCGAACTANLCNEGLTLAWKNATIPAAGGADVISAAITASAPAAVGDEAEPAYVQGGWLATLSGAGVPASMPSSPFTITGTMLATEPSP